jgi:hypothetical protein
MSRNVSTTGTDVNITVTESINDAIFKALARIESNQKEMMLMMKHIPMAVDVDDGLPVIEYWEKAIRAAVTIACRRHRLLSTKESEVDYNTKIIVDAVIAILKHNDNR